jgi:hypothetical protein
MSAIRREEVSPFEEIQFQRKKISHEMASGRDQAVVNDAFTDVKNLVTRDDIGVMTKNVEMSDVNTATCTEFAVASS